MDLSRYPLERIFHFAAGVIPGCVVFLVFEAAHPGSLIWFFGLGFLGYRTKLAAILLAAFVLGNTLTAFLNFLGRVVGMAIGYVTPSKPSDSYDVAPWRDPGWRALVREVIGPAAPDDTQLITQELYGLRVKQTELLPESQRPDALVALIQERIQSVMNDDRWRHWYDHYHQIIVLQADHSFESYVRMGLNSNLQAGALYILIAATLVPEIRRWPYILPACLWVAIFAGEFYEALTRYANRWSTLQEQLAYLSEHRRPT
jgi:hypothetical protein